MYLSSWNLQLLRVSSLPLPFWEEVQCSRYSVKRVGKDLLSLLSSLLQPCMTILESFQEIDFIFRVLLGAQQNWTGSTDHSQIIYSYSSCSCSPHPLPCTHRLSILNVTYQNGPFVMNIEIRRPHPCHSEFMSPLNFPLSAVLSLSMDTWSWHATMPSIVWLPPVLHVLLHLLANTHLFSGCHCLTFGAHRRVELIQESWPHTALGLSQLVEFAYCIQASFFAWLDRFLSS